ncbi:hypothetical protein PYW08_016785 [Mythimna loreyi]|uniref:Uncharacterized protein n=1 Tax=Mythimna loreyi TaxID=667449 RepID=A0ACC2R0P9_9NEOP|nr:hypothetical protein PYW08_016785 [Mythimna loreyi]
MAKDTGDALSPIEDHLSIPLKSIFFHEASCRGGLNSRQACSVESAARAHPHWQINVLFSGPVTKDVLDNFSNLYALKQFLNIKFFRLHLLQYVKGTPVEDFVRGGSLSRSWWPIQHTTELLQLVTLFKRGGVCLDLDQLVTKSFEDLENNWMVRKSKKTLASCPLSISKDPHGKAVIDSALSEFGTYYKEDKWRYGSSVLLTSVLQKLCNTSNVTLMSAVRCQGFKVLNTEMFFPVRGFQVKQYFAHKKLEVGNPYAHHFFDEITARLNVTPNSVYAKVAKKYCPTIYEIYGDKFGM